MPYHRTWHSSPFMSPPLLIILLPIIALTILFFAVPPLLSATTHVLRPSSVVKKSWDSLNILLVVFAILCGVFARRNDDESSQQQDDAVPDRNAAFRKMRSEEEEGGERNGGYVSQQQWFGFSEETKGYDPTPIRVQSPATGVTRLRRSSSSYPDLRNWETCDDRFRFRFFDDLEIDKQFRSPARDQVTTTVDLRTLWPGTEEGEVAQAQVKEIPVDTFETRSSSPPPEPPPKSSVPPTPPPPPPPPPPPLVESHRKPRRTYRKVESVSEITELDEDREFTNIRSPPPAPPTPQPVPPPGPLKTQSEHKHKRSEQRKSSVKRDIATVWASVLSNQKKKKKQRPKTNHKDNYDNVIDELTNSNTIQPPSPAQPPPPPPPPPPSVFYSLFRKGLGKSKKIHSVSAPPPPPPPPPLTSSRRWSKWKSPIPPPPPPPPPPPLTADPPQPLRRRSTGRPPLPNKVSIFNDEALNAVNQSPLIPVPPPPPPFKMPAMKFVVRGDFVRIRSNQSSRCSSPERDEIDTSSSNVVEELETAATVTAAVTNTVTDRNGDNVGSVFCPSPDVNVKAATFIARLRGEWKLEKLNSLKEKKIYDL